MFFVFCFFYFIWFCVKSRRWVGGHWIEIRYSSPFRYLRQCGRYFWYFGKGHNDDISSCPRRSPDCWWFQYQIQNTSDLWVPPPIESTSENVISQFLGIACIIFLVLCNRKVFRCSISCVSNSEIICLLPSLLFPWYWWKNGCWLSRFYGFH